MRTRLFGVAGIAFTALILIGSAHANAIWGLGNAVIGNSSNINNVTGNVPTDGVINGFVSSNTSIRVQVSSETNPLCGTSGGVFGGNCLGNPDGLIHNVTINPCLGPTDCFSFRDFQFEVSKFGTGSVNSGVISAVANICELSTTGKCIETKTVPFGPETIGPPGTVHVITSGPEAITSITIDSTVGFEKLESMKMTTSGIEEIPGGIVPEPSSMLLLGSGVLACTQVIRRKRLARGLGI